MKRIWLAAFSILVASSSFWVVSVRAQEAGATDLERQLERLQRVQQQRRGDTTINPQVNPTATAPGVPGQDQPLPPDSIAGQFAGNQAGVPPTPTFGPLPAPPQQAPTQSKPSISHEAFTQVRRNALPLTPDQIRNLHQTFNRVQRAAAEHPGVPPRPTSTSKIVDLSPGATPPIIRLSAGFVSSLVFLDTTGAPWPIKAYDLGDPKSFNVQWDKKSNTLLIQALTQYRTGNLAVILQGLNTPIMLTLLPGQRAVDYRVDLRMPGLGPHATTTVTSLPGTESSNLLDVLNGVPPRGSRRLTVSGCKSCDAWLMGDRLFLRMRLTLLSPAWSSTMSSADGTHAYQIIQEQSTPVLLVSEHGKMRELKLEGF